MFINMFIRFATSLMMTGTRCGLGLAGVYPS
jgi:hypothetical protein